MAPTMVAMGGRPSPLAINLRRCSVIDIQKEHCFALCETPKHFPVSRRGGRPLNRAPPFRWARFGLRGVRLETGRVAGNLCTSREALQRLFDRLTDDPVIEPAKATGPQPCARDLARVNR